MLEEIKEDENFDLSKKQRVSQEDIRKMLKTKSREEEDRK